MLDPWASTEETYRLPNRLILVSPTTSHIRASSETDSNNLESLLGSYCILPGLLRVWPRLGKSSD